MSSLSNMYRGKMIFVIPDVQDKPNVSKKFLRSIGKYIVHKRPDIIVCLGDFADMESLSTWDKKTLKAEGKRYKKDIDSTKEAMEALLGPIRELNLQLVAKGEPIYRPDMQLLLGNHEHRITRAANESPEMEDTLSIDDLGYESFGWKVHPFLKVVNIEGVAFSHYLTSGLKGMPISTAAALPLLQIMTGRAVWWNATLSSTNEVRIRNRIYGTVQSPNSILQFYLQHQNLDF